MEKHEPNEKTKGHKNTKGLSKKQDKDINGIVLTRVINTLCYKRADIPKISYIKHDWYFNLADMCFKHTNSRYYLSKDVLDKIMLPKQCFI